MEQERVSAFRPGFRAWRRLGDLKAIDAEATYGCVDWYLYQDAEHSDGHKVSAGAVKSPGIERARASRTHGARTRSSV